MRKSVSLRSSKFGKLQIPLLFCLILTKILTKLKKKKVIKNKLSAFYLAHLALNVTSEGISHCKINLALLGGG